MPAMPVGRGALGLLPKAHVPVPSQPDLLKRPVLAGPAAPDIATTLCAELSDADRVVPSTPAHHPKELAIPQTPVHAGPRHLYQQTDLPPPLSPDDHLKTFSLSSPPASASARAAPCTPAAITQRSIAVPKTPAALMPPQTPALITGNRGALPQTPALITNRSGSRTPAGRGNPATPAAITSSSRPVPSTPAAIGAAGGGRA